MTSTIQAKLTSTEWESIERPLSLSEMHILRFLCKCGTQLDQRVNMAESLSTHLKLERSDQMDLFLFHKHLKPCISAELLSRASVPGLPASFKLKQADNIRLNRMDAICPATSPVFEFVLIKQLNGLIAPSLQTTMMHYYTLCHLMKRAVVNVNPILTTIIRGLLSDMREEMSLTDALRVSPTFLENNAVLSDYADLCLYAHQKRAVVVSRLDHPKLVFYMAPTGTGKTITPIIFVSGGRRIIFVCAARHIGLSLARTCVSVGIKPAFAFGCSCTEDIRLHYSSAVVYATDKRSGRISKVDHTVGHRVEVMICDVESYLYAMYYMTSFHVPEDIDLYWDEPTITLDRDHHELHPTIHTIWKNNIIPNIFLSSFTLPDVAHLTDMVDDFHQRFPRGVVFQINGADEMRSKSVPIIDPDGFVVMPHLLSPHLAEVLEVVSRCQANPVLLRYIDLTDATEFIMHVIDNASAFLVHSAPMPENVFNSVEDMTKTSVKQYYLQLIQSVSSADAWQELHVYFKNKRVQRIATPTPGQCGVYLTTKDAHTMTNGPTIFIADDVNKMAKFCVQQSNIPTVVLDRIREKMQQNRNILHKLSVLDKEIEDKSAPLPKTSRRDSTGKPDMADTMASVALQRDRADALRNAIQPITLNAEFVPNSVPHIRKWTKQDTAAGAFTSDVDDATVERIMGVSDVDDSWKLLLLMGIGIISPNVPPTYVEVMKTLSESQKLYLVIANDDYIYGTNYQFCHGYIGKDAQMSQEKILQGLGRIGRFQLHQPCTMRFRSTDQIHKLFRAENETMKPEVINFTRLFRR